MIRLNKYIASSGYCSRRKADELIEQGQVFVNDKMVKEMGYQMDEKKDIVTIDGKRIAIEQRKIYLMLNKPPQYITTNQEQLGRKCTKDLIHEKERVFPIGRLDKDSEGLLLFTNDGSFANNLMHPSKKISKTYLVKLNRKITDEKIKKLEEGVDIGDYITKPATIKRIASNVIEITISEGKNRQIRRMCQAIDLRVETLKRIKIGTLELGNLAMGTYRHLTKREIERLIKKESVK